MSEPTIRSSHIFTGRRISPTKLVIGLHPTTSRFHAATMTITAKGNIITNPSTRKECRMAGDVEPENYVHSTASGAWEPAHPPIAPLKGIRLPCHDAGMIDLGRDNGTTIALLSSRSIQSIVDGPRLTISEYHEHPQQQENTMTTEGPKGQTKLLSATMTGKLLNDFQLLVGDLVMTGGTKDGIVSRLANPAEVQSVENTCASPYEWWTDTNGAGHWRAVAPTPEPDPLLFAKHLGVLLGPQVLVVDGNVVTVSNGVQFITKAPDNLVEALGLASIPRRFYAWNRATREWDQAEEQPTSPQQQEKTMDIIIDKPGTYLTKDGQEVEILTITKGVDVDAPEDGERAEAYGYLVSNAKDWKGYRFAGSWRECGQCITIADEDMHGNYHVDRKKPDVVKLWILRTHDPKAPDCPPFFSFTSRKPAAKAWTETIYDRDERTIECVGSINHEQGQALWAEPGDEPK